MEKKEKCKQKAEMDPLLGGELNDCEELAVRFHDFIRSNESKGDIE
jgi:hypothetical protein